MNETLTAWAPRMLSSLRILAASLLLLHGSQKLFGFPPVDGALPPLLSKMGLLGVIEFFGSALVVAGLFTRPAALLLAATMAGDYLKAHAPMSVFPTLNHGDYVLLWSAIFLYLVFAGPGPWSLDAVWSSRGPRAGSGDINR
jgi:putative oxidoreductase